MENLAPRTYCGPALPAAGTPRWLAADASKVARLLVRAAAHLVDGDDVAESDTEVLADDLVHTNLGLVDCVVRQDNAHSVLALLALHRKTGAAHAG